MDRSDTSRDAVQNGRAIPVDGVERRHPHSDGRDLTGALGSEPTR